MAKEPIKQVAESVIANFTRPQFIERFKTIVKNASKNTGLFPSVFMAQAILESNNGNSGLSKKANNFFGIKADPSWLGDIYTAQTREVVNGKDVIETAKFRKYSTPELSFIDRVQFLIDNKRYKNAGVFSAKTPEEQAKALKAAGYATDPLYAELLIKLINQNNLKSLDV